MVYDFFAVGKKYRVIYSIIKLYNKVGASSFEGTIPIFIVRQDEVSMNEDIDQSQDDHIEDGRREDVVLNLTLAGGRECILDLLERMDSVPGFSVLDGSFIVNSSDATLP